MSEPVKVKVKVGKPCSFDSVFYGIAIYVVPAKTAAGMVADGKASYVDAPPAPPAPKASESAANLGELSKAELSERLELLKGPLPADFPGAELLQTAKPPITTYEALVSSRDRVRRIKGVTEEVLQEMQSALAAAIAALPA